MTQKTSVADFANDELWALWEAAFLLCDQLPIDEASVDRAEDGVHMMYRDLKNAVVKETLRARPLDGNIRRHRVDPSEAVKWLSKRGRVVPPGLQALASPLPAEGDLHPRERDALLRILYGMALAAPYGYDPAAPRNEATATIASATAAAGCAVDTDTVRKYLKQAADKFGTARRAGR